MSNTITAAGFVATSNVDHLIHATGTTEAECMSSLQRTLDSVGIDFDADKFEIVPASARLVAEAEGGCSWEVLGGVACLSDELEEEDAVERYLSLAAEARTVVEAFDEAETSEEAKALVEEFDRLRETAEESFMLAQDEEYGEEDDDEDGERDDEAAFEEFWTGTRGLPKSLHDAHFMRFERD